MQTPPDQQRTTRRSAFPAEAVTWLVAGTDRTVAVIDNRELAGALASAGHRVAALPSRTTGLPFHEHTMDAVVAAGELPEDLDRVAEILRPGGRLALVCHRRDHRIPWVRKLDAMLGHIPAADPSARLVTAKRFGFVEEATYRYWQVVNHESLAAILRSELAGLDPAIREQKVARAMDLYADYGRGNNGMQMPWVTRCYRASVVDRIWSTPNTPMDTTYATEHPNDPMLLIDFR